MLVSGASHVETLIGKVRSTSECLSGVEITAVVKPKYLSRYTCVYNMDKRLVWSPRGSKRRREMVAEWKLTIYREFCNSATENRMV